MKLTLGKCFDISKGLDLLLKTKLPGVAAFRAAKIAQAVAVETTPAQETRMKIVANHDIEIDQKDGMLKLVEFAKKHEKNPEKIVAFEKEWNDLHQTEVTLKIKKIKVKNLEDIEIDPEALLPLLDLFEEEDGEE